jgi:hypothetical protein
MKVVLMRKLAATMDGIDVAEHQVGDVLDLTPADARILVAEQWGIPDRRRDGGMPPSDERRRTTLGSGDIRGGDDLQRAS